MGIQNLILVEKLCTHYDVELSFFKELDTIGLIEIVIINETQFIHQDKLSDLEKMIRLQRELDLNLEGIDIVLNLLQKVEALQRQLNAVNNRLRLYEND
jgi:hypothetical protein